MEKEKPKYRFCWECSRKLWGNRHAVRVIDGHERILHKCCAKDLDEQLDTPINNVYVERLEDE